MQTHLLGVQFHHFQDFQIISRKDSSSHYLLKSTFFDDKKQKAIMVILIDKWLCSSQKQLLCQYGENGPWDLLKFFVVTQQDSRFLNGGFTRPSSVYFSLGIVRDVVHAKPTTFLHILHVQMQNQLIHMQGCIQLHDL